MRNRLCIQPVALSWRMAASTIGKPVSPALPGPVGEASSARRATLSVRGSKWPPFTELRIVDHQMAVKLAPDQLVKPGWRRLRRPARRDVPSADDAGTGGGQHADGRGRATGDWSLPRPGSRAALVIRRRLLTKRAQTRQRRFSSAANSSPSNGVCG